MAKQTINPGTAPTGAGGDTFRSGSAKLQANDDEIYNYLGDGTNLNKLGTAAFKNTGTQVGNVMEVGAFGLGGELSSNLRMVDTPPKQTGFFGILQGLLFGLEMAWGVNGTAIQLLAGIDDKRLRYRHNYGGSGWTDYIVYTTQNTQVDPNGFIKAASPIVSLYADKIELNEEAKLQPITFEKLGVGDYLVKGSLGFAQEGWYIEMPKDANSNVLVAVIYEQLEDNDISVKTYAKKFDDETGDIIANLTKPRDIPTGRWIDLRLQELPQPEIEIPESIAPPNFQPTGLAEAVATVMESYHDPEQ